MRREFIGKNIEYLIDLSIRFITSICCVCGIADYSINSGSFSDYSIFFQKYTSLFVSKILPLISILLSNEPDYLKYNIMNISYNRLSNNNSDKIYKLIITKLRILYTLLLTNDIILFSYSIPLCNTGIRYISIENESPRCLLCGCDDGTIRIYSIILIYI